MSGDRKPQKGDRVRVTFEGVYVRSADGDHHIVTADQDWSHETPNGAVVEVLESADDPSKDPVGTLRREDCEGTEFNLWQRVLNPKRWLCTRSTTTGMVGASLPSSEIGSWPVVGVVPGTPAAEQTVTAEQVEQWETDDLELAVDPHKPVVLVRAETTQPRVFSSDGPEPPADVLAVESVQHPHAPYPIAARCGGFWVLKEHAAASCTDHSHGQWEPQEWSLGDSFREVLS